MSESNLRLSKREPSSVFIRPLPDGKWIASIARKQPTDSNDYVFIVREGKYPVNFYYERYDVMGSRVVELKVCSNRDELLGILEWCGQCRDTILQLWDHDYNKVHDEKLEALYCACAQRRQEIALETMKDFMEGD